MRVTSLIALMFVSTEAIAAQQITTIRPDGQCAECRIEILRSVALGDETGSGTIDHSESVAVRDSRGNFIVNGNYSTFLKVFDRSGRFVRTIGREGGGPGEFRGVGAMDVLPGDTLVVFDWGTSRYSLFSAHHEFLAAGPLPLTPEQQVIAIPTGDFVFNSTMFSASEIGQPLHRVGRDGKLTLSFGSNSTVFRPDVPYLLSRAITRSRGSLLWSSLRTTYQVDLLDSRRGTTVRSLRRDVSWFPPATTSVPRGRAEEIEPKPFIFDVTEDSAGLLWVLIGVPDPEWRRAVTPARPGEHAQVLDDHGYRDTLLEVIDPAKGTVLATARMKERVSHFVSAGIVGTVLEGIDGIPRLQTWTVRLVTTPQAGSR